MKAAQQNSVHPARAHTCVRIRTNLNPGKGCEKHKVNEVDEQVEQIEPQPKVKPLVVQQAADYRMNQQIKTFVFDLQINARKSMSNIMCLNIMNVLTHHKCQRMV